MVFINTKLNFYFDGLGVHLYAMSDIFEIEQKTMKSNTASAPPADNVVARTCEGRIAPALEMFDPSSVKL